MNKERRDDIQHIACQLEALRSELENIQADEEECRDNIPETLQDSARYEAAEEACYTLSEAVDGLEDIITSLNKLVRG